LLKKLALLGILLICSLQGQVPAQRQGLTLRPVLVLVAERDFSFAEFQPVRDGLRAAGLRVAVVSRFWGHDSASCLPAQAVNDSTVVPDLTLLEVDPAVYSGLVVTGGIGSVLYWSDSLTLNLVRTFAQSEDQVLAAIGIGPVLLARAGALIGRRATAYADLRAVKFLEQGGARYENRDCVVDGRVVTAADAAAAGKLVRAVVRLVGSPPAENQH
jgi:protease I